MHQDFKTKKDRLPKKDKKQEIAKKMKYPHEGTHEERMKYFKQK